MDETIRKPDIGATIRVDAAPTNSKSNIETTVRPGSVADDSPNYELIAKGYGIAYEAVTDRKNLAAAVEKMLATKGPFILECAIKEDDDVLPMTPPGMNVDDMMLEI